MLRKLISIIKTINFSFIKFGVILTSEKRTERTSDIKIKRRNIMGIIFSIAYTAVMAVVMTKITEHLPE